jgi:hypothetical protein
VTSSHRRWLALAALASALGGPSVGCGDAGKATPTTSSPTASAAPAPHPAASYADTDLAVPEDFEADADRAVTRDTYKRELDEIAKEISPASP